MAIYSFSTKPIKRSDGRSATGSAAYRAAAIVHDGSSGRIFDYRLKRGVEHSEIVLSTAAARRDIQWARDRGQLWNCAEAAEKRKDARPAREFMLALPHELSKAQRIELVRAFASELANRYETAVDVSLHKPDREGDKRNFHAHLLMTTRQVKAEGLGAKTALEWSNTDRYKQGLKSTAAEIVTLRQSWEGLANEHLKAQGLQVRIDARSLKAQGIDRKPTTHLGVAVWGMERRGIETRVGLRVREQQRLEAQARLERAAELGRLVRERQQVAASILDLSGDLKAARAVSQFSQPRESEEELRRQARERWLAYRSAMPDKDLSAQEIQQRAAERWLEAKRRGDFEVKPGKESGLAADQEQEQEQKQVKKRGYGVDDDFGV